MSAEDRALLLVQLNYASWLRYGWADSRARAEEAAWIRSGEHRHYAGVRCWCRWCRDSHRRADEGMIAARGKVTIPTAPPAPGVGITHP